MKLFIAGFDTETNTFAPIPTGIRGFEEGFMAHGDATRQQAITVRSSSMSGADLAEAAQLAGDLKASAPMPSRAAQSCAASMKACATRS